MQLRSEIGPHVKNYIDTHTYIHTNPRASLKSFARVQRRGLVDFEETDMMPIPVYSLLQTQSVSRSVELIPGTQGGKHILPQTTTTQHPELIPCYR